MKTFNTFIRLIYFLISLIIVVILLIFHQVLFNTESSTNRVASSIKNESFLRDEPSPPKEPIETVSLKLLIQDYLTENGIDSESVTYSITDLVSFKVFELNHDDEYIGASLYKLPLAMLYYDKINKNELSFETLYYYENWMNEPGGVIYNDYHPGSNFDLSFLLNVLIEHSDNVAGHILYSNYGGWEEMRTDALKYTSLEPAEKYYELENYMTTHYINDVLVYLYEHQAEYSQLLESMSKTLPFDYLNSIMHKSTLQKTGYNFPMNGAAGLVLDNHPYAIAIITNLSDDGLQVIVEINQITYHYFN